MIQEYIHRLIHNLPKNENATTTTTIDVVFDGGVFNGSYLLGIAYFLKEMEKKNMIKIGRISACSIGAFIAMLYVSDNLDVFEGVNQILINEIKTNYSINVMDKIADMIKKVVSIETLPEIMTNKVYINYYNVKTCRRVVKYKYKTAEDVIETIRRSTFVPFLVNGDICYKNRYMDGLYPYVFKNKNNRKDEKERRILYIDLHSCNKMWDCINIKNEKTHFHRVLTGVLEIHNFFIKNISTDMCSYVDEWSSRNKLNDLLRWLLEKIIVYMCYIILQFKKIIPEHFLKNNIFMKIMTKIIQDVFIVVLESFLF